MQTNSKNTCSACGNSPINHSVAFAISFVDEHIRRFDRVFLKVTERKFWQRWAELLERLLLFIGSIFGVVSFNSADLDKALVGRSKIIWEEARRRNIPMEQLMLFGKPTDYYRARINGKTHYFNSLPVPPKLLQVGYRWVDDKLRLAEELERAGIPAPRTRRIKTLAGAREAFEILRKPVIVKPEWGSRGRHTTTNISTVEELEKAFKLGREISTTLVLQEHLSGSVCRATVIDNKLVGFYRADQPAIVGDGVKKVRELIEEKNKNRHERVSPVVVSEDLENFISRSGYTLESILPVGETLNLSAKTGRLYGSYTKEMFPEVHPKMHGIFEKAGRLCEAPVLGFDLIIADATKDPDTVRWGIIECNSLPYIDLHYFALEGEPIDLAKNVWDLWDK